MRGKNQIKVKERDGRVEGEEGLARGHDIEGEGMLWGWGRGRCGGRGRGRCDGRERDIMEGGGGDIVEGRGPCGGRG